ncbi:hypothetical protein CSIRO_0184 [Bradyrhizobiaceae bacterium SG-6C]|nr:hypothetical protein CSIRO_0184 [Bradyrhizobiaceae bacterium SG-6C]
MIESDNAEWNSSGFGQKMRPRLDSAQRGFTQPGTARTRDP